MKELHVAFIPFIEAISIQEARMHLRLILPDMQTQTLDVTMDDSYTRLKPAQIYERICNQFETQMIGVPLQSSHQLIAIHYRC